MMNKIMVIGRVGADAELKTLDGGTAVLNFRVASTEVWEDKNGVRKEHTEWHRCVMWGPTASSLAKYITKGRLVHLEGRNRTRSYTKNIGGNEIKFNSTEIKVDELKLLDGRKEPSKETQAVLEETFAQLSLSE